MIAVHVHTAIVHVHTLHTLLLYMCTPYIQCYCTCTNPTLLLYMYTPETALVHAHLT